MTTKDRLVEFMELMEKGMGYKVAKSLLERLYQRGFFDCPASTKYHGNYPGGLFDHSYAVAKNLVALTEKLGLQWQREASPYIVGMLHDLCKCDQYTLSLDGKYEYVNNLPLPGHGEKSVILAQIILGEPLTGEEVLCIRWHMGAFDEKTNWNSFGSAIECYENVLWTHTADMMASRIQGV
ncbi:MAG: hypothetical protein IJ729_00180 [Alloprevotella sp.]|nr:hypothetical protein [Alloprevotella sp.]